MSYSMQKERENCPGVEMSGGCNPAQQDVTKLEQRYQ